MPLLAAWAGQQLAEFLATISACSDAVTARHRAVERAAEALEAEVAALVTNDEVLAAVGFPRGHLPAAEILTVAAGSNDTAALGLPGASVLRVPLHDNDMVLLMLRIGGEPFRAEEQHLVASMGRVLSLAVGTLATLDHERARREESQRHAQLQGRLLRELQERQRLLERLSRIQRSISHRQPLQEVLDAITAACGDLIGAEVAALRVIDPDDANYLLVVSATGVYPDVLERIRRTPVEMGVGGRAVLENRLIIWDEYAKGQQPHAIFVADELHTAMAAPVHENGEPVGSLTVASYARERSFSRSEQEALRAFAEHASLALADARTVEAMREAQRAKDMFLAMVSHELKTPLTVIMASLQTLRTHGDVLPPATHADILDTSVERGRQLERLIDRLLKGARAELAGDPKLILLSTMVFTAIRGFEQSRPIQVGAAPAVVVKVDIAGVTEALGVLVENAIAHSPSGTPVSVEAAVDGDDAVLSVRNAGRLPAGVPTEQLFQPFQRGAAARSSGVGLGLFLASRLAESMGGWLTVHEDDENVTFALHLPAVVVRSSLPEPRHGEQTWPSPGWTPAASTTG